MFRFLIFALIFCTSLQAQQKPPFEISQEDRKFLESLPKGMKYGWIEVSEDYRKTAGEKLHVFYYWRPVKNTVPVVFMGWGPLYEDCARVLKNLPDQTVIFVDARGEGLSSSFPELNGAVTNVPRYKHYMYDNVARDMEVVRKHLLGDKKWVVGGAYTGALAVQNYLMLYPQNIKSIHVYGEAQSENPQRYLQIRLKNFKKLMDSYFKVYPKDKKMLEAVKAELGEKEYVVSDEGILFKGQQAIMNCFSDNHFTVQNYWADDHDSLHHMANNRGVLNKTAFKRYAASMVNTLSAEVYYRIHYRLEVYDLPNKSLTDFYRTEMKKMKESGDDPLTWFLGDEHIADLFTEHPVVDAAGKIKLGRSIYLKPSQIKKVLSESSFPFYLYGHAKDNFYHKDSYNEIVKALGSKVKFILFEKLTSEDYLMQKDYWKDIRKESASPITK